MNWMIVIVLLTIVSIGIEVFINYERNSITKKLEDCLSKGKYNEFDQLIESKSAKRWIPEFNRIYIQLNKDIMCEDHAATEKLITEIRNMKLADNYKGPIYTRIYNYYLSIKAYDKCKLYYRLISEIKNYDMTDLNISENTFVKKGYKYLDDILKKMETMDEDKRGMYEMLVSIMYENKGDQENAIKYQQLAEKHLNQKK